MRSRYPSTSNFAYSFGPGPLTPAIKALVIANVVAFAVSWFARPVILTLGLQPADVLGRFYLWQPFTYMFLHGGLLHLLFNMLALWMFGTELERIWGTRYFLKYYFACGIGAAVLTVLFSLLPIGAAVGLRDAHILGASGAIYGLRLASGLYCPDRPILRYMVFPSPAKYFVILMGAIAFYSSLTDNGGVANMTHLGGLIIGYLMLKGARLHPLSEMKYWYLRWKMQRVRRKFGVYQGGRSGGGWDRRVH